MQHFYGRLQGRSKYTAPGTKNSGLVTHALSKNGGIYVTLHHNSKTNEDTFRVEHHLANGDFKVLARGIVGKGS